MNVIVGGGVPPANLYITTNDPYAIYAPGDKIRGTAHLLLLKPLLAKYVKISLRATCSVSARGGEPGSAPKQSSLLKQFKFVFHNKYEDPQNQLNLGKHEWAFDFDLPSSNDLPPSFFYQDQHDVVEIIYRLVMFVCTTGTPNSTKENTCRLTIKYSPKRSRAFLHDPPLSLLCRSVVAKRPIETELASRRRNLPQFLRQVARRPGYEEETFHISVRIPRYAVFSEHMDITLKIESGHGDYTYVVEVRLLEVHYRLWASTRIAQDEGSRIQRHQVQGNVMTCGSVLYTNNRWAYLRRQAPFRVQPRLHGMCLDKHAFGTLGPSFGTQHIVREYSLDVDLFLSIHDKTHRVRFDGNELILLPYEFHMATE